MFAMASAGGSDSHHGVYTLVNHGPPQKWVFRLCQTLMPLQGTSANGHDPFVGIAIPN